MTCPSCTPSPCATCCNNICLIEDNPMHQTNFDNEVCYYICEECQPYMPCGIPCIQKGYKYIQPPPPESFAPTQEYTPPTTKMERTTVYKDSFTPIEPSKTEKIVPEDHLCIGDGRIASKTVTSLSYQPYLILVEYDYYSMIPCDCCQCCSGCNASCCCNQKNTLVNTGC